MAEFTMETEEPKKKKGKEKRQKTNGASGIATFGVVAVLFAIVIFFLFTVIEKNVVSEVAKTSVVVAIKDVPEGILLTKDNIPNYFAVEARPTSDIPAGAYTSANEMVDMITARDIAVKEMVNVNTFKKVDLFEGVDDPVIFSITVGKPGQAVAGTLRAGDLVDIRTTIRVPQSLMDGIDGDYTLDDVEGTITIGSPEEVDEIAEGGSAAVIREYETSDGGYSASSMLTQFTFDMDNCIWSPSGEYVSVPLMDAVRVYSVYTSAGVSTSATEADGSEQVATIISVVIPRSMQSTFALACADGDVYFAKVVDATKTTDVPTEEKKEEAAAPTATVE